MSNARAPYDAYKKTGVNWLPEIPSHWEMVQSRRLFEQRKSRALPGDRQLTASQKYGVIYQEDFIELEGRRVVQVITGSEILKHVEPNDFVMSMRSFQGGLELCRYAGSVSSAYIGLIPIKHVFAPFFAHLFKSLPYIQALQSTSNLVRDGQALRFENFSLVDLPIVPLAEQQAIATFLDHEIAKIDRLIAKQARLIELLKEKRQAVISHAVTKGLNHDAPMKDSGVEWLGEVPAHWHVRRLKHLLSAPMMYGANEAALDEDVQQPRFIRITDLDAAGGLKPETFKSLPLEIAEPYLLRQGDLLLARSGATVGKSFLYDPSWGRACFAGYLIRARIDGKKVMPEYVSWYCQSRAYWQFIQGAQIQATIQNVSAEKYGNLWLAYPACPDEQQKIIAFLSSTARKFENLIDKAQQAIELLQEHRVALISAAVTGKIDVRGWQKPNNEPQEAATAASA